MDAEVVDDTESAPCIHCGDVLPLSQLYEGGAGYECDPCVSPDEPELPPLPENYMNLGPAEPEPVVPPRALGRCSATVGRRPTVASSTARPGAVQELGHPKRVRNPYRPRDAMPCVAAVAPGEGWGAWGKPHVSLRHACDAIGLAHDSQRRKLNNRSWACVTQWVTQMPGDSGGHQLGGHPYRRAGARWSRSSARRRVPPSPTTDRGCAARAGERSKDSPARCPALISFRCRS